MKNVVYVVTATDAMDYERGNFGETVKVFSKRSDAVKWIKEQRAEQKEWPNPIRDIFTYKKFEVV